jgi:hypothetical protein
MGHVSVRRRGRRRAAERSRLYGPGELDRLAVLVHAVEEHAKRCEVCSAVMERNEHWSAFCRDGGAAFRAMGDHARERGYGPEEILLAAALIDCDDCRLRILGP